MGCCVCCWGWIFTVWWCIFCLFIKWVSSVVFLVIELILSCIMLILFSVVMGVVWRGLLMGIEGFLGWVVCGKEFFEWGFDGCDIRMNVSRIWVWCVSIQNESSEGWYDCIEWRFDVGWFYVCAKQLYQSWLSTQSDWGDLYNSHLASFCHSIQVHSKFLIKTNNCIFPPVMRHILSMVLHSSQSSVLSPPRL